MSSDINVLVLPKPSGELYAFLFPDSKRAEIRQAFGSYAANDDLSFDWIDCKKMDQAVRESEHPTRFTVPIPE